MSIKDRDYEDSQIKFVETRISRHCLGHETGSHVDGITLPCCAGFDTNNMKRAKSMEKFAPLFLLLQNTADNCTHKRNLP